ncbi:hypothetical protein GCM10008994_21460 [Halorubrum ejinorense]|uniref:Uncharacterized protein n=1 Tax=Halorubrum ejinorense TaxID=425309 RepID=A0AAV3STM3_9EURY
MLPGVRGLPERGGTVTTYNPVSTENAREYLNDIDYSESAEAALAGTDGAVVVTEVTNSRPPTRSSA